MLLEATCLYPPGKLMGLSPTDVSNTVVCWSLTSVLTWEFELKYICFYLLGACSFKAHLKRPDTSDDLNFLSYLSGLPWKESQDLVI